jgi:hypothetical protein
MAAPSDDRQLTNADEPLLSAKQMDQTTTAESKGAKPR